MTLTVDLSEVPAASPWLGYRDPEGVWRCGVCREPTSEASVQTACVPCCAAAMDEKFGPLGPDKKPNQRERIMLADNEAIARHREECEDPRCVCRRDQASS